MPSPVARYQFEEGTGTVSTADSVGSATGTLHNAPTWIAGRTGVYALNFSGSSQNVTVPTGATNSFSGDFTIVFWMRSTATGYIGVVTKRLNGNEYNYDFSITPAGKLQFAVCYDTIGGQVGVLTPSAINDGAWHRIVGVAVADATTGTLTLYVDGSQVDQTAYHHATVVTTSADLAIGGNSNSNFFVGDIDDVATYGVAFDAIDALNDFAAGSTAYTLSTVGLFDAYNAFTESAVGRFSAYNSFESLDFGEHAVGYTRYFSSDLGAHRVFAGFVVASVGRHSIYNSFVAADAGRHDVIVITSYAVPWPLFFSSQMIGAP